MQTGHDPDRRRLQVKTCVCHLKPQKVVAAFVELAKGRSSATIHQAAPKLLLLAIRSAGAAAR